MSDWDPQVLLDYYEFAAELKSMDSLAGAAEAHGILCGQFAGGMVGESGRWRQQFLQCIGVRHEPAALTSQWLDAFSEASLQALKENDLTFMPLLPDDTEPLYPRLESLSEWCSGFLAGFGSVGHADLTKLDEDTKAIFNDLVQISRVDSRGDASEDDEQNYAELVEYVRMAAIYVFTSFGAGERPVTSTAGRLH
jgi:uncharacterized protein YgfB (UPF0149 family)